MPRKEWVPKNKYCRRSKLSEYEFRLLVYYYFYEVFHGEGARSICYRGYQDTRDRNMKKKEKQRYLSKQGFSKYFQRLGQYMWDNFIVDLHPDYQKEDVFDELLDLIYGKTTKISSYKDFYNSFCDFPFYIKKDKETGELMITGSLMYHLLSTRSKNIRGFKKDKFYLEFTRIYFLCASITEDDAVLPSIYHALGGYDFYSVPTRVLLDELEKKPL